MSTLKASERAALLRGDRPRITRKIIRGEATPFDQGETIVLRKFGGVPQVWVTILNVKRTRKGNWDVDYSFRDDRPLFLRRGGNLTRVAADSCDPEAPVIDPATQKAWAAKARLEAIDRKDDEERRAGRVSELAVRHRERAARDRLRETLQGLEPSAAIELLARVERDIENARKEKLSAA